MHFYLNKSGAFAIGKEDDLRKISQILAKTKTSLVELKDRHIKVRYFLLNSRMFI